MTWAVLEADCTEAMAEMAEASVDAIVTDPPYGLEFMGKEWDAPWRAGAGFTKPGIGPRERPWPAFGRGVGVGGQFQDWCLLWGSQALRVLKPGGHLLAFGGTRTYHRLACALEDAGFEIRDCLAWLYGSGFPKSLDVSKAIDKAAGVEREVVGVSPHSADRGVIGFKADTGPEGPRLSTAPATPDAERWQGWGTALKPSHEPIVLARKPLSERNVAANVLRWGTGALNIAGCRIGDEVETWPASRSPMMRRIAGQEKGETEATGPMPAGRWPANVTLDPEAAAMLDSSVEPTISRRGKPGRTGTPGQGWGMGTATGSEYDDAGGPSRFFYTAKASRAERNIGLVRCECETEGTWASADLPAATPAGTDTPPRRDTTGSTSMDGSEWPTSSPGSEPTGRSPKGSRSTTATTTSRTTGSRTSSSSTLSPTSGSTRDASSATGSGGSPADDAASSSPSTASTGISAAKAGRSTGAADPATSGSRSNGSNAQGRCPSCGNIRSSFHPTVKPIALMGWLCRLVTPPGGLVLDPFAGSGSTLIAALREGFDCIGIERDAEYVEIARARIQGDAPLLNVPKEVP